ncbi:MAG: serine/threonine-protein kinase [Pyrinomonadaceae bacterium]
MKVCPVCERKFPDKMTLCSADASVLKRVDDPHLGQTLAGKYKIEKLIKTGGMGSVYRGRHVLMDKTVAIKVLRPSLAGDDAVVARFSREAKAASKISHPHAVSVTDFGEAENGVVFLVMEYLDGRTLKEAIAKEGPLSLGRAVEIVRQVAGALDAAHGQGVIHRDLKSDNIMLVSHNGGEEWAKVLDFGIAKILQPVGSAADAEITQANLVVGTPQYMSPEQCSQSGALDARSDVYSLGIIVHEMLTGKLPFTGDSATVVMMKQVQDAPPSVLASRSHLPAAVDRVIKRALAKQPIDRFQSAGELSAALAEAASAEAAEAPVVAAAAATNANTPVSITAVDDVDEETIVRPRHEFAAAQSAEFARAPSAAPAVTVDRFNPWRIIVPAAIALVVVFAAVFLLTRGTSPSDPNQLPLNADPNSTPVQPTGTPTGQSEMDVRPISVATPTPVSTPVETATKVPATVTGNFGSNENTNTGRGNRNSNQPARPTPEDEPPPPPPRPSPTVRTIPTPEAAASPRQP